MNTNISYREQKKAPAFDWHEFLNREEYCYADLDLASIKASSWVMCAVGSQCSIIPRFHSGRPMDAELEDLGCRFMTRIDEMRYYEQCNVPNMLFDAQSQARYLLQKIEERSAFLIEELQPSTIQTISTNEQ